MRESSDKKRERANYVRIISVQYKVRICFAYYFASFSSFSQMKFKFYMLLLLLMRCQRCRLRQRQFCDFDMKYFLGLLCEDILSKEY